MGGFCKEQQDSIAVVFSAASIGKAFLFSMPRRWRLGTQTYLPAQSIAWHFVFYNS
jgi:hypothetical protein